VKNALITAWKAVQKAFGVVWNWLKSNVFNPIKAMFAAIGSAAGTAASAVRSAWEGVKGALKAVYDWIKSHVLDPLSAAFDAGAGVTGRVIEKTKSIKIPGPVQRLINRGKGVFSAAPAPPPAPAPQVPRGRRGPAPAATAMAATPGAPRDALGALGTE